MTQGECWVDMRLHDALKKEGAAETRPGSSEAAARDEGKASQVTNNQGDIRLVKPYVNVSLLEPA